MQPYPLRSLAFYKVKKDFTSDRGFKDCDQFQLGQILQYQKSISNIHDMIEIVHFIEMDSKKVMIWNTYIDNLYDHWEEYLEPVSNPCI